MLYTFVSYADFLDVACDGFACEQWTEHMECDTAMYLWGAVGFIAELWLIQFSFPLCIVFSTWVFPFAKRPFSFVFEISDGINWKYIQFLQ